MKKFNFCISLLLLILWTSALSSENSSAYSRYMSPEGGVNPMTGTVALQKELASLSIGQVSTNFTLKYSGNVFKEAETENEYTTSGIVGLGWSLGRSKIICDCKENAFLGDDIYYLVTADGNRFRIYEENQWKSVFAQSEYNSTSTEKWVVEGNPFWTVERRVGEKKGYPDKEGNDVVWKFVIGWVITDAEGIVHQYGDLDEVNSLDHPKQNATEYDIIWTHYEKKDENISSFGLMETAYGGKTSFYPVAWNLSKEIDYEDNYLQYSYLQITEPLHGKFKTDAEKKKVEEWTSTSEFTKESYLSKVEAFGKDEKMYGGLVRFVYKNKGEGDFDGEYKDNKGIELEEENDYDMFREKISRKYLSEVRVYGSQKSDKDSNFIGNVVLCYSVLQKGTPFVKRLLGSVRFFNKKQDEVDYENYYYKTNLDSVKIAMDKRLGYPLGALDSIKGKDCGWVKYEYKYESIGYGHVEELPVDTLFGQGTLEDGTPYLVGLVNKSVKIYTRVLGRWIEETNIDSKEITEVQFGDAGWFLAIQSIDGKEEHPAYVYAWNGKNWAIVHEDKGKKTIFKWNNFGSPILTNLVAGPDYVLKYKIKESVNKMSVDVVWKKWAGTDFESFDISDVDINGGAGHTVQAKRNHILIGWRTNDFCSGNCLNYNVYLFDRNLNKLVSVKEGRNLDSENHILLNGSSFIDAGEDKHAWEDSRVNIYNWNGNDWVCQTEFAFSNADPADVPVYGEDYFAVRYADRRFLRIFGFDGNSWTSDYYEKLLRSWSMNDRYYWTGVGGRDFFVTTRAYQKHFYNTMHKESRMKLFYKKNGSWIPQSLIKETDNSEEKKVITGNDWFLEKKHSYKAWIWDGSKWNMENLRSHLDGLDYNKIVSLGANIFAVFDPNNHKTKLFYKVKDTFTKPVGAYVIRLKSIKDPVTDKIVDYKYSFLANESANETMAYDDATNSPLMGVMKVEMPSEKGIVEQRLCSKDKIDGENVAVGKICKEIQWNQDETNKISETKHIYARFRKKGDIFPVYVDQEVKKIEINRGVKKVTSNTYSLNNGLVASITNNLGENTTEQVFKYIQDLDTTVQDEKTVRESLIKANRINILAGEYKCIPNCESGKIISATANGLSEQNGIYSVNSFWKYLPINNLDSSRMSKSIQNVFFNNIPESQWELQSSNEKWLNGQVVETFEGPKKIKVASFVENKKQGKVLGSAANCGVYEGLMLSGESCNVAGWEGCVETVLKGGSAINYKDGDDRLKYGRFSKRAIQIKPSKSLIGVIDSAKNEKYLFTAWVQTPSSDGKLVVKINDKEKVWNLDSKRAGQWNYIEWDTKISERAVLTLEVKNTNGLNLQDIRLLPESAVATTTFWNDEWDKVETEVNANGVASFVTYDNQGRQNSLYSETIDRKVYLSSKTIYRDGYCSVYPEGSGKLRNFKINAKAQKIPESENLTGTYTLNDVNVFVEFETLDPNDRVKYKLYPVGEEEKYDWKTPCCGGLSYPNFSFNDFKSWVVEVDVSPFENGVYKFFINKKENDWVEYGDIAGFGTGKDPKYVDDEDSSSVVYKDRYNEIYTIDFSGNRWGFAQKAFDYSVEEFYAYTGNNNSYLVHNRVVSNSDKYAEHPQIFRRLDDEWKQYNENVLNSTRGESVKVVENEEGVPVYLFTRTNYYGPKLESDVKNAVVSGIQLCAKKWVDSKNEFEYLGATPVFENSDTQINLDEQQITTSMGVLKDFMPGVVNDADVFESDIVMGPENKMYVAYLGNSTLLGNRAAPLVYIKQLYEASENVTNHQIWAGVSQQNGEPLYLGDVLSWSGKLWDAVVNVDRMKFTSYGDNLYLAVSYEVYSDNDDELLYTALSVFKGSIEKNVIVDGVHFDRYLRWTVLEDESIKTKYLSKSPEEECKIIAYVGDNYDFDLEVRKNVPTLMFWNSDNNNGLTVLTYKEKRWQSIGSPAFAYPMPEKNSADLGANADGNPFVVLNTSVDHVNDGRKNKLLAMHYNSKKAPDLTLKSFETKDEGFNSSCSFRQYIVNYTANVDKSDKFSFKVSPRTESDVNRIEIYNGDVYNQTVTSFDNFINLNLNDGLNRIELRLIASDNSSLSYFFNLHREFYGDPGFYVVGGNVNASVVRINSTSIQLQIAPKGTVTDDIVHFDVHFETGWKFKIDKDIYTIPGTVEISKSKLPLNALLISPDGISINVDILNPNALTSSFDLTKEPWFDTTVDERNTGNNGEDDVQDDDISSDGIPGINNPGSGSDEGEINKDMSENVPEAIRMVTDARIFAAGNINVADGVTINGKVFSGKSVSIGVSANAVQNIYSADVLQLRNRAKVGNVFYKNHLDLQDGASYQTATKLSDMQVSNIPNYVVNFGIDNIVVENGSVRRVNAGSFNNFTVRDKSNISFSSGDFYFNNFYTDSWVVMNFEPGTRIWIAGDLRIGNNNKLKLEGLSGDLFIYVNGNVSLETNLELDAVLVAPNANVRLSPGSHIRGYVLTKTLNIEPNCILE